MAIRNAWREAKDLFEKVKTGATTYIKRRIPGTQERAQAFEKLQARPEVQKLGQKIIETGEKHPFGAHLMEGYLKPFSQIYQVTGEKVPKRFLTAKAPQTRKEKIASGVGEFVGSSIPYMIGGSVIEAPLAAKMGTKFLGSTKLAKLLKFSVQSAASTPFISPLLSEGSLKERFAPEKLYRDTLTDIGASAFFMGGLKLLPKSARKQMAQKAGDIAQVEGRKLIGRAEELVKLSPYRGLGKDLLRSGYSEKQIIKMTPAEAHKIITSGKTSTSWLGESKLPDSPSGEDLTSELFKKPHVIRTKLSQNVRDLKDISTTSKGFKDVYRNFKQVYGKRYSEVKRAMLDPLDFSKGRYIDYQKKWTDDLKTNVVDKYGFKKGSKESAAIQQLGEGVRTYDSVVEEFGKTKAKQVVEAGKWFRTAYDKLLDQVNQARRAIYPNNPEMIIPKRKDYFRHFKELSGLEGLKNIFEGQAGIDPLMVGISDFTTPKSKWLSFAQKRLKPMETEQDAVGGFLEYLPKASYASFIDLQINKFRNLSRELAEATSEGIAGPGELKRLNNFVEFLEDYANDLAGKTNPLDRGLQKYIPGGRKTFAVINWANRRVKANVILGNLSSALAQIFNVPQGIASAGEKNFISGIYDTAFSSLRASNAIDDSIFIRERYAGAIYSQFDTKLIDQPKKLAVWITGVLDEAGTKMIWNAHYRKALNEGLSSPKKYADDITRDLVAGRGVGEVPIVQKSKIFQLVAPFQLEVANMWHVMKDFVNEKQFTKLAKLFVYTYFFNGAAKKLRGSNVTFDPIDAIADAYDIYQKEPDKKMGLVKAGGRLGGEVLSNVPLGQTLAATYPESGFNVGEAQMPPRRELFGKGDPTRFGSGLLLTKGLQDPLYKVLPPFGGQQVKRGVQSVKMIKQGYSETPTGRVKYRAPETTGGKIKALALGQYSTSEAREYYKKKGTAVSKSTFLKHEAAQALVDNNTDLLRKISGEIDKNSVSYKSIVTEALAEAALLEDKEKRQEVFDRLDDVRQTLGIKYSTIETAVRNKKYSASDKQKQLDKLVKAILKKDPKREELWDEARKMGITIEAIEKAVKAEK